MGTGGREYRRNQGAGGDGRITGTTVSSPKTISGPDEAMSQTAPVELTLPARPLQSNASFPRLPSRSATDVRIELTLRNGEVATDVRRTFESALHGLVGQLGRHKQRHQDHRREVPPDELARLDVRDTETAAGSGQQARVGQ